MKTQFIYASILSATLMAGSLFQIDSAQARVSEIRGDSTSVNLAISEAEVREAQQAWGNALVQISSTHDSKGRKAASEATDSAEGGHRAAADSGRDPAGQTPPDRGWAPVSSAARRSEPASRNVDDSVELPVFFGRERK